MSHMFGLGKGWLPRKAAKIAKNHGAMLVNYTDPGCRCGYGCGDNCPACRRHWFETDNRGEPFNSRIARTVLAEIALATNRKS